MNIRCVCGNETTISPGGNPGYILRDESWLDRTTLELRCPKCKSAALPIELVDAGSPVKVRLVPGRTIPKRSLWA